MKRVASPKTNWRKLRGALKSLWGLYVESSEFKRAFKRELGCFLGLEIEVKESHSRKPVRFKVEAIKASPWMQVSNWLYKVTFFGVGARKKTYSATIYKKGCSICMKETATTFTARFSYEPKNVVVVTPQFEDRLVGEKVATELECT